MTLVLRNARFPGGSEPVDLLVANGTVTRIAAPPADVETVDLAGRFVVPGLWDAHVHFDQWAATRRRLDLAPARSAAQAADIVRTRIAAQPADELVLGYGFRDGLWPAPPSLDILDAVTGKVPTVLVSGDLHAAWLNSAAFSRFGIPAPADGTLRETDWMPIMNKVAAVSAEVSDRWATEAAVAAAARGVVGVIDFELPDALPGWQRRFGNGFPDLRVVSSVWPEGLEAAIERGWRTGDVLPDTRDLLRMGPLKVVTDGSLNTRTAYCHEVYPGTTGHGVLSVAPDLLADLLRRAKSHGLLAAVHAIGDWANALALDAFAAVGLAGTIEHAQLVDAGDFARMATLGLTASVQPEHLVDDRDVADRYWTGRTDRAFAYRSLLEAGVTLALGSDAPVAPLDPWPAMGAAVFRTKDGRDAWHAEQSIPLEVALAASARGRTNVEGGPDDLVIVDADPLSATADLLRAMPVAGTLVSGRWSFRAF